MEAYRLLEAIKKLARSHVMLEAQVEMHEDRLERIEDILGDPGKPG